MTTRTPSYARTMVLPYHADADIRISRPRKSVYVVVTQDGHGVAIPLSRVLEFIQHVAAVATVND